MLINLSKRAILLSVCLSNLVGPAFADNVVFTDLTRGTLTPNGDVCDANGRVIGHLTYNAPGSTTTTVIAGTSAGPRMDIVLGNLIDARRAAIANELARMQAAQAANYKAELDRIAEAEAAARRSNDALTFDETVRLARELDALNGKVTTVTKTTTLEPLVIETPGSGERLYVTKEVFKQTSM